MRFLGVIVVLGLVGIVAQFGCRTSPTAPPANPMKVNIQTESQPQSQEPQGRQLITFGVRWPQGKALNVQAIPDGARLVRFSVSKGSETVAEVDVIRDPTASTTSKSVQLYPGEYSVIAKAYPDLLVTNSSPVLADGGANFTVVEGQDTAVSIALIPLPSPSPTPPPSSTPTPTAAPTSTPLQPTPTPQVTPSPSPSPTTAGPLRTVNISAERLLGSNPVAGVRVAFQDVSGKTVGSVTTGAGGKASIALPAVRTPPYWGAYYKLAVTLTSGTHFSVTTIPYTGGTNDLMVPPYGGTGDGSQPVGWDCSVVISMYRTRFSGHKLPLGGHAA